MATKKNSLKPYQQRRDFKHTPEPSGTKATVKKAKGSLFVVQKHAASHLHFDFRIQIGKVLKSWAIPKGISPNPAEKHLAIPTEDHPLAYAHFEGTIPEGNYGAGTVMVWDIGTYKNIKEKDGKIVPIKQCLNDGRVELWLEGTKMRGGYALIRTQLQAGKQWLVLKMNDQHAARSGVFPHANKSALTGRTMKQIAKETGVLKVGKQSIELTNQDKILFPRSGITKGELIEYYQKIAPYMLPYMKDRAITMHRFPDGITHEGFYQKDISDYFPDWIQSAKIRKEGGYNHYVVCNDAATLVYLANQACITPHIWLSRINKLDYPDKMIFDLDPGKDDFSIVRKAAFAIRDELDELGLKSFVMTTGSRGLHVIVPLKSTQNFDTVRAFARNVADRVAAQNPKLFTTEVRLNKRRGRLFIDSTRNAFAQTTVAPYAVRAHDGAPVAMPISWDELKKPSLHAQSFTIKNIFKRLEKNKNPWPGFARCKQLARPIL